MNPVLAAIRAFLAWRRARKTAPIAQARARRADLIVRERRHHRPVRDLYRRDFGALMRVRSAVKVIEPRSVRRAA